MPSTAGAGDRGAPADRSISERRLPDAVFNALADAGLFRLWLPEALGGPELSPAEFMTVVEAASALDGSVGWLVGNGGGMSRIGGYLPEPAATSFSRIRTLSSRVPRARSARRRRSKVAIASPVAGLSEAARTMRHISWVSPTPSVPMAPTGPCCVAISSGATSRSTIRGGYRACARPAAAISKFVTYSSPNNAHMVHRARAKPGRRSVQVARHFLVRVDRCCRSARDRTRCDECICRACQTKDASGNDHAAARRGKSCRATSGGSRFSIRLRAHF